MSRDPVQLNGWMLSVPARCIDILLSVINPRPQQCAGCESQMCPRSPAIAEYEKWEPEGWEADA